MERQIIELKDSLISERSATEVFDYLLNPANFSQWNTSLLEGSCHCSCQTLSGIGCSLDMVFQFLGKKVNTCCMVIEYEQDAQLVLKSISGPLEFIINFDLASAGIGTEINFQVYLSVMRGFFEQSQMVVQNVLQHIFSNSLVLLCLLVEKLEQPKVLVALE